MIPDFIAPLILALQIYIRNIVRMGNRILDYFPFKMLNRRFRTRFSACILPTKSPMTPEVFSFHAKKKYKIDRPVSLFFLHFALLVNKSRRDIIYRISDLIVLWRVYFGYTVLSCQIRRHLLLVLYKKLAICNF